MKKEKRKHIILEEYFRYQHEHPSAPFNPDYDPKAAARYSKVTASLESDNWYATHTKEGCKAEWGRRYDELKAKGRSS